MPKMPKKLSNAEMLSMPTYNAPFPPKHAPPTPLATESLPNSEFDRSKWGYVQMNHRRLQTPNGAAAMNREELRQKTRNPQGGRRKTRRHRKQKTRRHRKN